MSTQALTPDTSDIRLRALREDDLANADRIMRMAFGTFLGMPDPITFMGDADYVSTRWRTDPSAAIAADFRGELGGSNFATNWGSVGFFGPLTIRPDLWDRGIGGHLVERTMECFARWGTKHAGLFTFAQSPKHLGLYQKFGFWPSHLTAIMSKPVAAARGLVAFSSMSELQANERPAALLACRELTNAIYDGLDVAREIGAIADQGLGETVLLWESSSLAGFAICHCGPGTEAGGNTCYIKFGAVRPGLSATQRFERLLEAAEQLAATRGLAHLVAGVNTARHEAYRTMLARSFRIAITGVSMHRSDDLGYHRPDVFVIDDWR